MKSSIVNIHFESIDLERQVQFYKDELNFMERRIEEVASKNTANDVLAQVEHFQNKINLYREECQDLLHDLSARIAHAEQLAKGLENHIYEKFIEENSTVNDKVQSFIRSITGTRMELNQFLSKVL